MKIISPFKDYYDNASYIMHSDEPVYLRKEIEHFDGAEYDLVHDHYYYRNYFDTLKEHFEYMVLFFCGKAYPFAKIKIDGKVRYIFDKKECEKIIEKKRDEHPSRYRPPINLKHFEKHQSLRFNEVYNCPIILLRKDRPNDRGSRNAIILNPQLSVFEFYRIIDPNTCYQEIFMWMNSVHRNEKPIAEIEDKYKIQQHGFDKASFRKPPTKKKVK